MDIGVLSFIKHLAFLKGDGVFWTMPVEFMFYLILPFVVLLLMKGRTYFWLFIVLSLAYSVYHFLIYSGHNTLAPLKLVEIGHSSQFLSLFVMGVVMGVISKNKYIMDAYLKNESVYNYAINVMFFVLLMASFLLVSKSLLGFHQPFYLIRFMSFIYAVSFGFVLLSLANGNEFLRKRLANKVLVFIGKVGFSWYLLHMLVLEISNQFILNPKIKFMIATLFIASLSLLTFKVIEEPFMKLGKRISAYK